MSEKQFEISAVFAAGEQTRVVDFLAARAGLTKGRIKDAMLKGAVWLQRGKARSRRLRRASSGLQPGDRIELFYAEEILALSPPPPQCEYKGERYSVWFKPPGLLTQGTKYGDHCSLLRLVEKRYRIEVFGNLENNGAGSITEPLDNKPARTSYQVLAGDPAGKKTLVDVCIETGRKHQIRRHFAAIGFPVLGDPIYGSGNKNTTGLRLLAYELSFRCPEQRRRRTFRLPEFFLDEALSVGWRGKISLRRGGANRRITGMLVL